jgi:hypothetical protein
MIRVAELDGVIHKRKPERQYLWRLLWRQRLLQLYRRKVG